MLALLSFEDILDFLPFLFAPLLFGIVFVVIIVAVIKRAKAELRKQDMDKANSSAQYPFTLDGNGRTEHQRDYLNAKRRELSERKVASQDGSHEHRGGTVENYGKIVGSLGEVNDEGCDELDGIRLIEHDEAYCDDPDHILSSDPTELERAIVLGEVLNNPRYKQPYHRK